MKSEDLLVAMSKSYDGDYENEGREESTYFWENPPEVHYEFVWDDNAIIKIDKL